MNRLKQCFLVMAFAAVAVFAQSPFVPTQEPISGLTAKDFLDGIRIGWNLGNTMDAVNKSPRDDQSQWKAEEGTWGAGRATQTLFNGVINESGFDAVRIPVTYIGHIGEAPDYTINPDWLARVDTIVNYAKTAGARMIIINVHHDGHGDYVDRSAGDMRPEHAAWLRLDSCIGPNNTRNEEVITRMTAKLSKVWEQIATRFRDYGDYLIFETTNEVHGGNWGGNYSDTRGRLEQEILWGWNQAALNAIRATGGNNPNRFIAVPAIGGTDPPVVEYAHFTNGKLFPNDGANGRNKLIVSAHYYDPKNYTVNISSANPKHTWGTPAELTHLETEVGRIKRFIDAGIAAYIGECGAPTNRRVTISSTITSTVQDNHIEYMSLVAEKFREIGAIPIIWDDGGWFKLLERSNGKPAPGGFAERVLNGVMDAVADIEITSVRHPSRPSASNRVGAAWSLSRANGNLYLRAPVSNAGPVEVALYDVRGRMINKVSHSAVANGQRIAVNARRLPAGNYMVVVRNMASKRELYSTRVAIAQ